MVLEQSNEGSNDPTNDAVDGGPLDIWDLVVQKGEPGVEGPAGPSGPSGTIQVDGVNTVFYGQPADVINNGSPEHAFLEFYIPEGPEGPPGPPGPTGDAVATVCTALGYSTSCDLETLLLPRYALGDTGPAGGIVVHITDNGRHGLEAAPNVAYYQAPWGCQGQDIVTSVEIGAGQVNTTAHLNACLDGDSVYNAFETARDFSVLGFNDWFLPSINELALYFNYSGGVSGADYWSSSGRLSTDAWIFRQGVGGQAAAKRYSALVLPYRKF